MEVMQRELVVRWYQDHGEWVRRIVMGVAIAFLSYGLLSLWPVYSSGIIILCAVVLGLVGAEKPTYALGGFFLAFAPSFLYGSGSLAVVFILFFLLVLSIPKIADTQLKVTLILAAPFALHFGWFFFAAILGGLVYANAAVIQSAVGAMLAFSVAWLRGWHVIGVFPSRAAWIALPSQPIAFPGWFLQQFAHFDLPYLSHLGHGIAPYSVSIIAGIIIISLTTRLIGVLRKSRGIREDALSIFLPSIAAGIAWSLMANEIHPALMGGIEIVALSLLVGVVTFLVGRALPSWVEPGQPLLANGAPGVGTQAATNTSAAAAPSRLRQASWDDIAGYADVKDELREAVQPYMDKNVRQELEKQGLPMVGGILFYGAPGTGKTLFGRVLASETNMRFFSVSGPEFFSMWVGESERKLREIFAQARAAAPAMIFFDEVESFLASRDDASGQGGSSLVSRQVVATFLAEMDGALSRGDVLVVAATNHPDLIDSAAIRPGRFDKIIFIPPPDEAARRAILTAALAKRNGGDCIDIDPLVVKR